MAAADKQYKNYVFYEVSLKINAKVIHDYDLWLQDHVQQMLELPGFVSASVNIPDKTMREYQYRSVTYRLRSKQALEDYFEKYAEKMRGDGLARFAGKFSATRRVYVIPKDDATEAYAQQLGQTD